MRTQKELAKVIDAEKEKKRKALAAERKRRQREKEKSNANLYEEKKQKERERYHKRVKDGKIKKKSEMPKKDLNLKRKMWRKSTAKYRAKKKAETKICDNPAPTTCKERGRKKVKSNRAAVYRNLKEAEKKNANLLKTVGTLRKRLTRMKPSKLSPPKPSDTPQTRVNKLLKGVKVGGPVKKKLLFGEILQDQLKCASKTKKKSERHVLNHLLSGRIYKKYKCLKMTRSLLSERLQKKYGMDPRMKVEITRQPNIVSRNRTHDVFQFYLRDDVSTVCPDKKGYVLNFTNGKVKKRKRYLRGPLTELYQQYSASIPNPVSYTTFVRLKPFYCVRQKMSERNTCLCTMCENIRLLASALHRSKILEDSSLARNISSVCCDPRTEECLRRVCSDCMDRAITFKPYEETDIIDYKEWKNLHNIQCDKDGKTKKTPKWKKVDCSEDAKSVVAMFTKNFEDYMAHVFRDSHQQAYFREIRENLGPGDLYLHYDWSKNYALKANREIQSAFFGASNEEISLHTGMAYLANNHHGFCTVSDNTKHSAPYILAHIIPIIEELLKENPGITRLYLQSDSPTSQYRNKDMFYLLTQFLTETFPQITVIIYGYSESGHGKGQADGIGGWCKTTLDQEVLFGIDISSARQAVAVLKNRTQKTKIMFIDSDAHQEIQRAIPQNLKTFEGTTLVHSFTWTKELKEKVFFGSVSCKTCEAGTQCVHFGLPNSPLVFNTDVNQNDIQDPAMSSKRKRKSTPTNNQPAAKKSCLTDKKLQVNGWVAVLYNNFWYPGVIEKVTPRSVSVNFMVRHETQDDLFLWPPKADMQQVKRGDILYKLSNPPVLVDRTFYTIAEKMHIDALVHKK